MIERLIKSLSKRGVAETSSEVVKLLTNRIVPDRVLTAVRRRMVDIDELHAYSIREGGDALSTGEERTVELGPIATPESQDSDTITRELQYPYGERIWTGSLRLAVVPDVSVFSEYCIPTFELGYIPEFGLSEQNLTVGLLLEAIAGSKPWRRTESSDETAFESCLVLDGPHSTNYYHWFRNYVPRLEALGYLDIEPTLIIPRDPPRWLVSSLELLDVDGLEIVERPRGRFHTNWYVNTQPRSRMEVRNDQLIQYEPLSPDTYNWISERMKSEISEQPEPDNERVYISRKDATGRRTINEDRVVSALQNYGFEKYTLSNLTLREQIRLFSRADAIVGAHGAGLINMLFAEDASVIELLGPKTTYADPGQFYVMSQAMGHQYGCVEGDVEERDLRVDTSQLVRLCERLLTDD